MVAAFLDWMRRFRLVPAPRSASIRGPLDEMVRRCGRDFREHFSHGVSTCSVGAFWSIGRQDRNLKAASLHSWALALGNDIAPRTAHPRSAARISDHLSMPRTASLHLDGIMVAEMSLVDDAKPSANGQHANGMGPAAGRRIRLVFAGGTVAVRANCISESGRRHKFARSSRMECSKTRTVVRNLSAVHAATHVCQPRSTAHSQVTPAYRPIANAHGAFPGCKVHSHCPQPLRAFPVHDQLVEIARRNPGTAEADVCRPSRLRAGHVAAHV